LLKRFATFSNQQCVIVGIAQEVPLMNDSSTGVTSCPDNVRPGAANGAFNRFAGRETQHVSGWMGVASIQPGSAVGYLFVVCIA
jgi:hypothetical protein